MIKIDFLNKIHDITCVDIAKPVFFEATEMLIAAKFELLLKILFALLQGRKLAQNEAESFHIYFDKFQWRWKIIVLPMLAMEHNLIGGGNNMH